MKKTMKKRSTCLLMAMMMACSMMSGCGSSHSGARNETAADNGYDGQASYSIQEAPMKEDYDAGSTTAEAESSDYEYNSATNDATSKSDMLYGYTDVDDCYPDYSYNPNTEEYNAIDEMGFTSVALSPLSTFSADVDTASYSNLRRMVEDGYSLEDIPDGAVRIEELLNYFNYDYDGPKKGEPFGVTTQIADCPWNENTKIAMIGLKTMDIDFSETPASNLVFLLDVSGSMYSEDKLPLLQKSFARLRGVFPAFMGVNACLNG